MLLTTEDLSSLLLFTVVTDEWVREVHRFTSQRKKKQCYVLFRNRNDRRLYSLEELKQELGNADVLDFVEFKTAFSHDIVSNKVGANSIARKCAKSWMAKKQNVDECILKAQQLASEVKANLEVPEVKEIKTTKVQKTAKVEAPKASVIENIVEEVPVERVSIPTETLPEEKEVPAEPVSIPTETLPEEKEVPAEPVSIPTETLPEEKELPAEPVSIPTETLPEEKEEIETKNYEIVEPEIETKPNVAIVEEKNVVDEKPEEDIEIVDIIEGEAVVVKEAEADASNIKISDPKEDKIEEVVITSDTVLDDAVKNTEMEDEEAEVSVPVIEEVVSEIKESLVSEPSEELIDENKIEELVVEITKDEPTVEIEAEIKKEQPVVEIVKEEPEAEVTKEEPIVEKEEPTVEILKEEPEVDKMEQSTEVEKKEQISIAENEEEIVEIKNEEPLEEIIKEEAISEVKEVEPIIESKTVEKK